MPSGTGSGARNVAAKIQTFFELRENIFLYLTIMSSFSSPVRAVSH